MDESSTPHNRRERRATARNKQKLEEENDASSIPMVKPDYDAKPTAKTLYEIAEERAALLSQGQPFEPSSNQKVVHKDGDYEFMSDEPLGAFANAVIYCLSLSMLHITLDVLVLSQYRQDVVWREIAGRMAKMTPALFLVVYIFHTEQVRRWKRTRQFFFLAVATAAGCYLIYAGNEFGYYYVMKRAPPTGTLWVWSVVEMDLLLSLVHIVVIGAYMWWGGYKAF